MDCRETLESIAPDLAGSLSEADHLALQAHIEGCAACRAQHHEQQQIWAALGEGCVDDAFERDPTFAPAGAALAPAFAAVVIPRLRAAVATAQVRRRARRLRTVAFWTTGASLAVAAGIAIVVGLGRGQTVGEAVPVVAVGSDPVAAPMTGPTTGPVGAPESRREPPAPASLPEPLAAFVANAPGTEGSRGQAIALVGPHFGDGQAEAPSELIAALTHTLRSDRNPGVRKKAAQALMGLPPTAEIRAAFIQALRKDPNPGIRIIAVEALGRAARAFDPASIETLRERADDQDESRNLRSRAARALQTLAL